MNGVGGILDIGGGLVLFILGLLLIALWIMWIVLPFIVNSIRNELKEVRKTLDRTNELLRSMECGARQNTDTLATTLACRARASRISRAWSFGCSRLLDPSSFVFLRLLDQLKRGCQDRHVQAEQRVDVPYVLLLVGIGKVGAIPRQQKLTAMIRRQGEV